jgi:hypothetical protein
MVPLNQQRFPQNEHINNIFKFWKAYNGKDKSKGHTSIDSMEVQATSESELI